MILHLWINKTPTATEINVNENLLTVLRRLGFFGAKSGGCKSGECGACTVLFDGKPINSCSMLAAQADGHKVETIEGIGERPDQGWKKSVGLDPIQQAFIESGAIQCGYCTPAMVLAGKSLLASNPDPEESEIRDAISGVLCRCTGYKKPVSAIKAASMESQDSKVIEKATWSPEIQSDIELNRFSTVGKNEIKVDAIKLVQGKPAFTADIDLQGMLVAKVLLSTVAHARIKSINIKKAKELAGVHSVLTWKDLPRVVYSTAGQSDPIPGPLDTFSLDNKVRFVGDRVAFVAAETEEIAQQAIDLIEVEYEELPAVLDSTKSMLQETPKIHDEPEYINFANSNPIKNLAAEIRIDIGDVDSGFKEADKIFENEFEVPKVQQAHIEPHVVITYWDENDRLVIRSSTQVPFHARRILSPVLNLTIKRIRVIKPRIGGGFGGKQEILVEDVAAHLTIATGRPVRFEYTREEEFIASRSRHPMKLWMKTGVMADGTITANEMRVLTDTGAYGCHALTVTGNTGHKAMALYVGDGKYRKAPNIRFYADVVYTNHPPAGAYRGYGVPQGYWAVERQMELIANELGLDPIEFRLKNALRSGELHPFSTAWSEGREPKPEIIHTVGLEKCVEMGKKAIGWKEKALNVNWKNIPGKPHLRKGVGVAMVMQGTAIPYLDMGAASIKMNDDGSFNLLIGATDLGTGSDTVLGQMAAEVLGVPLDDILVYSSDTDFTPFDKGAYASSTTYISGGAVTKAAEEAAAMIKIRAAALLSSAEEILSPVDIVLKDKYAIAKNRKRISLKDIALETLHHNDQEQIMGIASFMSKSSPPPFAAQFAEVTVDIETGKLIVDKLVMAVDSGVIVNPLTASGQIEGGMVQALGYAVCEEMLYDQKGVAREKDLKDYHIFRVDEMPEIEAMFVESFEPTHPFGVKAVAEIPLDGVAPAVANAIQNACGAKLNQIPATPERIWRSLKSV
ncbi:MAG: xanthine dehydrogenase [Chlorobiaceae bacterium]|nr:MAG: xdh [Chloroflexota bacterium]MBA4311014.1 xanthine dehydrogenase [Chlorobiaceae bacterium]